MLLFFAVLAIVSAAVLLISYHLWRNNDSVKQLDFDRGQQPQFRTLFEPSDDEQKAFERDEEEQAQFEIEREQALSTAERAAAVERCRSTWKASPNTQNTIDLLQLAADHGKADVLADVALEIIDVFREDGIPGLSAGDLAELLDSHYRLLPANERSSGELFLLKGKIAELAAGRIDKIAPREHSASITPEEKQ